MTPATTVQSSSKRSEWFASWFDSVHYHKLYGYRSDAEAARFLDVLLARLRPRRRARVLDLGCGAGRHAKYLASKNLRVLGMDLAAGSIREAKKSELPGLHFLQHDMRVPFGRDAFDYVFNFFTSFGYFENPDEHLAVVRNMATSLRQGGRLVLDYLNVRYADSGLTSEEVKKIDGVIYRLARWTDARSFFKRIVVEDGAGKPLEYVERVARFTLPDFERMFACHGLSIEDVHGDYQLNPYDALTSPRLILVATKRGDADSLTEAWSRSLYSNTATPASHSSFECGSSTSSSSLHRRPHRSLMQAQPWQSA
jgi:SAM-dependent methyltransferase